MLLIKHAIKQNQKLQFTSRRAAEVFRGVCRDPAPCWDASVPPRHGGDSADGVTAKEADDEWPVGEKARRARRPARPSPLVQLAQRKNTLVGGDTPWWNGEERSIQPRGASLREGDTAETVVFASSKNSEPWVQQAGRDCTHTSNVLPGELFIPAKTITISCLEMQIPQAQHEVGRGTVPALWSGPPAVWAPGCGHTGSCGGFLPGVSLCCLCRPSGPNCHYVPWWISDTDGSHKTEGSVLLLPCKYNPPHHYLSFMPNIHHLTNHNRPSPISEIESNI